MSEHRSERQRARSAAMPAMSARAKSEGNIGISEHRSERQRARSAAMPAMSARAKSEGTSA